MCLLKKGIKPMSIDIYTYLIVCPLVFLSGFVDAIAGGGGLISLPAYFISGLPGSSTVRFLEKLLKY